MLKSLKSDRGSVLLEFCLVLPIWLLILGSTLLLFDVSMAKFHLQESNRNLAWIQNDRFDSANSINKELHRRVTLFYDTRNAFERSASGGEPMWGFGNGPSNGSNPQNWAYAPTGRQYPHLDYKGEGVELSPNGNWANLGGILDNNWSTLCSGNMELRMEKISALYMGLIAVSSLMHSEGEEADTPLYDSAFTFTRADPYPSDPKNLENHNGEMLVLRRMSGDPRKDIATSNSLMSDLTVYRAWPSNGSLGSIELLLGI